MYHNKLQRMAKKEGKPWRIRVAAMVERLPVVTPDVEEWEQDYIDLRDFLMTFGKEYPAETGFMFAPDKEEDHIVESVEDLIGKFVDVGAVLYWLMNRGRQYWRVLKGSEF